MMKDETILIVIEPFMMMPQAASYESYMDILFMFNADIDDEQQRIDDAMFFGATDAMKWMEKQSLEKCQIEDKYLYRHRTGHCLCCGGDPKIVGELNRRGYCADCRAEYSKAEYKEPIEEKEE